MTSFDAFSGRPFEPEETPRQLERRLVHEWGEHVKKALGEPRDPNRVQPSGYKPLSDAREVQPGVTHEDSSSQADPRLHPDVIKAKLWVADMTTELARAKRSGDPARIEKASSALARAEKVLGMRLADRGDAQP
jgi:hypothetical protein